MVGKIYLRILVDRVHSVSGGLIDDEQGGVQSSEGVCRSIFILKQISQKAQEKKCSVCGFYRFGEGVQ